MKTAMSAATQVAKDTMPALEKAVVGWNWLEEQNFSKRTQLLLRLSSTAPQSPCEDESESATLGGMVAEKVTARRKGDGAVEAVWKWKDKPVKPETPWGGLPITMP